MYSTAYNANIADMVGTVYNKIEVDDWKEVMSFHADDHTATFSHMQQCCESVSIETIDGNLDDLVGTPILMAEQIDGEIPSTVDYSAGDDEWTFYKFATIKGYVTVRWYGTSNGYYSTSVSLTYRKIEAPVAATVAPLPNNIVRFSDYLTDN